jgi:hypothetical protein
MAYTPYESAPGTAEQLVLVRTNINGWFFDAVLRTDHTSKLKITEHPVQSGAAISDHAYPEPAELLMEIGITDAARSLIAGQYLEYDSRSVAAYDVLRRLQREIVPLQVVTRLQLYQNMLIESLSVSDDYTTKNALKATIQMREIPVVTVSTVALQSRAPQVTGSVTNAGTPEPVQANQSILKQITSKLTGGG